MDKIEEIAEKHSQAEFCAKSSLDPTLMTHARLRLKIIIKAALQEFAAGGEPVACRHEWYQGTCVHCEITPSEYRASSRAEPTTLAKGCHRSHPHENMDAECIRKTEQARKDNASVQTSPFSNCGYTHCDLPGQCRSEGECHHPRAEPPMTNEKGRPMTYWGGMNAATQATK